MWPRVKVKMQSCKVSSTSNMTVKSYRSDTDFGYVCTLTLTIEMWPWVKVMTHPWVMDNNCVWYYPDPTWQCGVMAQTQILVICALWPWRWPPVSFMTHPCVKYHQDPTSKLRTKRRRSDPVLWQKPLYQQKCQRDKVTTQTTPQKSSIKQQLRTDLGRSVGVTTATQLVWLTGLRAHLPTPRSSRVIKRTQI